MRCRDDPGVVWQKRLNRAKYRELATASKQINKCPIARVHSLVIPPKAERDISSNIAQIQKGVNEPS